MKRFFFLAALIAAMTFVGLTAGSARASTCASGYKYAGYNKQSVASTISASIKDASDTLHNTGHVAGWVGVDDGTKWIQAGLIHDSGGSLSVYIEINDGVSTYRPYQAAASYNTNYTVSITKQIVNGFVSWDASINGHDAALGFSPTESDITSEVWNTSSGTCNAEYFVFNSLSPWSTGQMSLQQDFPYTVGPIYSYDFVASGS